MRVESSETASILMRKTLNRLRFLEHRGERVRLGPAVNWRVD